MRFKQIFIVFILVVALLPYFVVCFYALPFADDFCYGWTASEPISFLQKFLNQYLKWNGRYTADVLVQFHPITTGYLLAYQLALLVTMVATPVILYFFIQSFLKEKIISLIASLFITLFYFSYMPNVTEGMYWFIGIVNYHIGNLALLVQLTLLMRLYKSERGNYFLLAVSYLLLIIAVGFNEIAAVLIPLLYFIGLIIYGGKETQKRALLLSHFALALTAALFVVFSPGNTTRGNEFPEHFKLFHSIAMALLQTVRFIGGWALTFAFMASILIGLNGYIKNDTIAKLDWRLIVALLFLVVFMGSFVPYFATGTLGQHRTINFVFLWFLMLWGLLLLNVSSKFSASKISNFTSSTIVESLVVLSVIVMFFFSNNGSNMLYDFNHNSFEIHKAIFIQEQKAIVSNSTAPENFGDYVKTFDIVKPKNDSTYWVNKCMHNFYTETKIELK